MQLVNEFTVDAPLDVAWAVLTDIPTVVQCIPGAELERQDGDDFHAQVAVKVGPVGMTLAGVATLVSRDDDAHEMVVRGNAADRKGNGSTTATVRMTALDDAGRSVVRVTTDLELSGRIAQFGQGVVNQVGNRIIRQFVARLDAVIAGDVPATDDRAAGAAVVTAATAGYPVSDRIALALTALAGVALGLAIGRTAERLGCPHRTR